MSVYGTSLIKRTRRSRAETDLECPFREGFSVTPAERMPHRKG
jgi:hypothetical protein